MHMYIYIHVCKYTYLFCKFSSSREPRLIQMGSGRSQYLFYNSFFLPLKYLSDGGHQLQGVPLIDAL